MLNSALARVQLYFRTSINAGNTKMLMPFHDNPVRRIVIIATAGCDPAALGTEQIHCLYMGPFLH
jgi:hypothetical protein